ncbi:MAG: DUF4258 domain-containing protein [Thermodesulfobacteriota bacterium]|nr:DUF4258 domain-containing protein [Thermodesulfobacteriota bacterium]
MKEITDKQIIFSNHAENKFAILKHHGFLISKEIIISTLEGPDKVEAGHKSRKIAQKNIDESHVIRVIFEELPTMVKVITFYPGRRKRYEDQL